MRVWNNSVEGYSQVIKSHSAPVKTVSISYDGQLLLSGSDDKMLKVWQLTDRKFMFSINAHSNWIKSAEFSPDTRLICSGSEDRQVKLWDVTTKGLIHNFTDHSQSVNSVKFHPDGTCVAAGSSDNSIKIWDIRGQRLIQHYDAATAPVTSIAFHPNGRYLLSSSADSTVKIWDLRQGHILYSLYGHEGPANSVSFSPNGDFFTTSGSDAIVMCWKSNLNELDTETIDDIGGKTAPNVPAKTGMPQLNLKQRPGSARAAVATVQAGMKVNNDPSPTKSTKNKETMSYRSTIQQSPAATNMQSAIKTGNNFAVQSNSDAQIGAVHHQASSGIAGSGEELALTLEKVVSQLDIISRTLHVLEQRVSMNESSVNVCMQYFRDQRERVPIAYQSAHASEVKHEMHRIHSHSGSMNEKLKELRQVTHTIKTGIEEIHHHHGQHIVHSPNSQHSSTQHANNSHRMEQNEEFQNNFQEFHGGSDNEDLEDFKR